MSTIEELEAQLQRLVLLRETEKATEQREISLAEVIVREQEAQEREEFRKMQEVHAKKIKEWQKDPWLYCKDHGYFDGGDL